MKRGAESWAPLYKVSPDPKFNQERCYGDVILCLFILKRKKKKLLPGQLRQIKVESNPDAAELLLIP